MVGTIRTTPDVRVTENGKKSARFYMSTEEPFFNDNGYRVVQTHWHQVVAWGKKAELAAQMLEKGTDIAVHGRLLNHFYTDKEGVKYAISEIVATDIVLLKDGKKMKKEMPLHCSTKWY